MIMAKTSFLNFSFDVDSQNNEVVFYKDKKLKWS